MLRLFEWIYSLGVHQERQRIARALEAELKMRNQRLAMYNDRLSDPKTGSSAKKTLEFNAALDQEMVEITNSIFEIKFYDRDSIMFPEGEDK